MENTQLFSTILLLLLLGPAATAHLEKIDCEEETQLTCAQDLINCTVKDGDQPGPDTDLVHPENLDVNALLCCSGGRNCRPCLRICIHFTIPVPEGSTDHDNEGFNEERDYGNGARATTQDLSPHLTVASIVVCYTPANSISMCKVLEFTVPSIGVEDQDEPEVWLCLVVSSTLAFGDQVYVSAMGFNRSIGVPSEQEVCNSNLRGVVKKCDVPNPRGVIDHEKGVARLELDNNNANRSFIMIVFLKNDKDFNNQILAQWKEPDAIRVESYPFANHTEFLKNVWTNTSLSVSVVKTNSNRMALTWNLSAPCRVEADVWLCSRRLDELTAGCEEVRGTRIQLRNKKLSSNEHWGKGEFVNIFPNPGLCVVAKVQGMSQELEHRCPFAGNRKHWIFPVFVCILLLCLLILVSILLFKNLKRKREGGHVVLLYPPDPDEALPELMYWLGSRLSQAGFSVSGDLWNRANVCSLGPLPWLHSHLERQQQSGGKVVLVLTRTTVEHAEEWALAVEKGHTMRGKTGPQCSPYSDVFMAALSCILLDQLQGRAGERFTLAHFDLLPALSLQCSRPLLELFRDLTIYSLPSQSSDLIAELRSTCKRAKSWGKGLQVGIWARMLGGVRTHRLSGLSQDSAMSALSNLQETAPLQPFPRP